MSVAKIYFLGGEDVVKRTMEKTNKRAMEDAGGNPVALVFPWTAEVENRNYRRIAIDYFRDIGAKRMIFAELTDGIRELREKIDLSDLIYLPGGDTDLLFRRLKDSGVSPLLKRYEGIILGNSAGSLVVCKRYAVVKGQDGRPRTGAIRGIGLVDFAVSVHYRSPDRSYSGEEPDKELRALSKRVAAAIYAIPENGALIFDEGKFGFAGEIYKFYRGKRTKCKN